MRIRSPRLIRPLRQRSLHRRLRASTCFNSRRIRPSLQMDASRLHEACTDASGTACPRLPSPQNLAAITRFERSPLSTLFRPRRIRPLGKWFRSALCTPRRVRPLRKRSLCTLTARRIWSLHERLRPTFTRVAYKAASQTTLHHPLHAAYTASSRTASHRPQHRASHKAASLQIRQPSPPDPCSHSSEA